MVSSTTRGEVALVGGAVRPRVGVVEVSVGGFRATAGGIARGVTGADQVTKLAAWGVASLGVIVLANVTGDRSEGKAEALQELGNWPGRRERGLAWVGAGDVGVPVV